MSLRCSHRSLLTVPVQFVLSHWRSGRVEQEPDHEENQEPLESYAIAERQ